MTPVGDNGAGGDEQHSESWFRQTLSLMPAAVYSCDATGRITYFNEQAAQMWGRAPRLGDTDHRYCGSELLLLPDGTPLPHEHCPMALALRDGSSYRNVEVNIRRPDGSTVEVLVNIDPVRDEHGAVIGAINAFHDISAINRAREALRESEDRFRMLADNMAQLAWTCDTLGNCTWYNRRWLDYTGLTFDELGGWDWSKVQHPDHLERVVARVKHSAATGEPWEDTFPLRGKDGVYRWFLSRAAPIRDANGEIVCWFGTNTDVDDQVRAENALREADRLKDEYLATLAHELRNPLAAIRNAVQILLRADGDAQTVRSASEILDRQTAHLTRQVDDLFDVTRVSRGKIELRKERTDVGEVVQHAVEASRPLCDDLAHEVIVTLPTAPIYVHADPTRLAQIVGNLLNNACKFTTRGGRIALDVGADGEHAVIRVRDTGIGIAESDLRRIFDSFAQVDRSLESVSDGLGLGLSLVKNLVELHGGTVEARSAGLGQGSEFVVRLPIVQSQPAADADAASNGNGAAVAPLRILIADDNRDSVESLAMLLALMGHTVDVAHDGIEAVAQVGTFGPDVALIDIGMPRLNGHDAARRIREQHNGSGPLLVALTGWSQEEDRRRSAHAGFDAHLVKPVDMAALTALLRAAKHERAV